ncbi:MAG: threonine--tRNA ligase [Bdellovibrionaceae bacterium]|nr:threonine--tRNA ligase [Pseudobdellovibrionaceae bacterium]
MTCRIQLPDGAFKDFESCPTALELSASISSGLSKKAVAVLINQEPDLKDIRSVLKDGDQVEIVTLGSEKSLEVIRHSSAHVLAQAVQNLWPDVKVTLGPVIENAFYYDFDTDKKFTPEDLEKIEQEMKSILKQKYKLEKEVWSSEKAYRYFEQKGELLKKEIIEDLGLEEVSIYKQGPWLDLCLGPHVQHLGQIGVVKVLSHSGAYWRGDSEKKQLQRIYGTAFHTEKQLKVFLKKQELAKQNDHRLLGKKLNLFYFNELSPGSPFFTPLGTRVYRSMQKLLEEKYKEYDYQEVITPQIYHSDLFQSSGHLKHYADNMYAALDREELKNTVYQEAKDKNKSALELEDSVNKKTTNPSENHFSKLNNTKNLYFLKPMNCPGHCLLYKKDHWSYKNLPWRVADFGRLHRREAKGAIQGLTRVKSFCQDDAHVFCRLDQLSQEIQNGIQMLQDIYNIFGLKDYKIELSTRPEKRMGEDSLWNQAELSLSSALKKLNIPYELQKGEGAFYGPKLDISIRDAFDRYWQLGTFQCDFNLPKAFNLTYVNEQDKEERPVMLHRAILGSLERFFAVYLEHCKGRYPTWLSPLPVAILPLTDKEKEFSLNIKKRLEQNKIICKIDERNEKLSYKVRESQSQQIPYMLIIGQKEVQSQSVSVRLRTGELFPNLNPEDFVKNLFQEIKSRSLSSFLIQSQSKKDS